MKKPFVLALSAVLALSLLAACVMDAPPPAGPDPSPEPSPEESPEKTIPNEMRDMTSMELVWDMGLGINLGNTFEATGGWIGGTTVVQYERAWGSPTITEEIIKAYADAGFGAMRIPVAWSNLVGEDHTIYTGLLDRVEEVVQWVLLNDMYAVINIHWDGGWWYAFPTETEETMRRFTRYWDQISEHFKDYGDMLLFESANEELGWNDLWNPWSGTTTGKAESYGLVNLINQTFVDLVRASGGNNDRRHLLIAGYHTDFSRTVDPLFEMPDDPAGRSILKVHYYDPFGFTHLKQDETWAKARFEWGTDRDYEELDRLFDMVKERFHDNGIPVIIGEYGMAEEKPLEYERLYTAAVTEAALERGFAPMLWCVQRNAARGERLFYMDRRSLQMADPLLEEAFKELGQRLRGR
jgi:endoglucanase